MTRPEQVSTSDVARSALERLQAELDAANAKLDQVVDVAARCEQQWQGNPNADQAIAYRVVGEKLRRIVGGTGVGPTLDQVRVVLEHCEQKAPRDEDGVFDAGYYEALYECPAYADVATRLRAIVDGGGVR